MGIKKVRNTTTKTIKEANKVQIVEQAENDLFDTITSISCLVCNVDLSKDEKSTTIINAVLNATSARQQSDIKAWEEEVTACEHSLCLEQMPMENVKTSSCSRCDLKTNLWLCLICGNVGCGRRQFDGSGGNNHGIEHFEATGHLVSCKLGTITAEGTADIYCYKCDDLKLDPYLSEHLAVFGIKVDTQAKTEKSMAELQLEQNLKFEFNMVSDDGKFLEPMFGPGLTGLKNIGNSCYLASVIQSLVGLPVLRRYNADTHRQQCTSRTPGSCILCQLEKLSNGLNGGKYSVPSRIEASEETRFQDGVPPTMFKDLVCKGHQEFSTARQQDAYEFLQYFLEFLDKNDSSKPLRLFEAKMSSRLQCPHCKHVGYAQETTSAIALPMYSEEETKLSSCIQDYLSDEYVEGFICPVCKVAVDAQKRMRFITFPKYLTLHLQRFVLDNWVPKKLNTKVIPDVQQLDLSPYQVTGKPVSGESLFPETTQPASTASQSYSNADLEQLMSMGFSKNRSIRALEANSGAGVEVAMEWLFTKMDDASLDGPLEKNASSSGVDESKVPSLLDMGFTANQARKALKATKNNVEAAVEYLFSNQVSDEPEEEEFVSSAQSETVSHSPQYELHAIIAHKGTSSHCGHYVAYVKHGQEWVLFNDEKVAKISDGIAHADGAGNGYLYLFQSK